MSKNNIISFFPTLEPRVMKDTGLFPVSLIVYFNGKRRRYRLQKQLSKDQWKKFRSPKLRDENLKELKKEIQEILDRAEMVKKNIEKENIQFSFAEFEARYFQKVEIDTTDISLSDCIHDYLDNYSKNHNGNELAINTIEIFRTLISSTNRFKKNVKITQITIDFLVEYEKFLQNDNKKITTIGIYLRHLRAILNFAILKKYLSADKYPFKGFKIKTIENKKRSLDENEIQTLLFFKSENDPEQRALDFWKFSYLANGINFKDIANLKFSNIQGNSINFIRAKTSNSKNGLKEINVFILPEMKKIIQEYSNMKTHPSDYVFPVLNTSMNEIQRNGAIKQFVKTTNKYLKRIGTRLNFDIPLTTYVSRHSWATRMRNEGVPTEYIKEGLGHSNIKTTENYLGKFPAKMVEEYANRLINFDNSNKNTK